MPTSMTNQGLAPILRRTQLLLGISQKGLGLLLECSSRSIIRYYDRGGYLAPWQFENLTRACHPHDPAFAAELAVYAEKTLIEMGLERPPAPPAPAVPAPPARPTPSAAHMLDSIVCAAAEAVAMTPQAMRPGLLAAFQRAVALGMSTEEVLAAMTPGKKAKGVLRPAP